MTAITWTGGAGDNNFDNALNWSPQQVPTSADTVTIDPAAATSIGFSVGSNAVQSLSTNSFVTLSLSNQETFTIGTSAATTFTNGGTFALNSGNQNTDLIVGATSLTLNGGGTIALDNNAGNRIYGAAAGDVLNNVNNLIQGAGQLGAGQLTFINGASGTVNADQANALVLSTGSNVVSNSGLLESTTGGGLVISSTTVNNGAGGHVSGAGGDVFLQGGTLQGGTLSSSGSGAIVVQGGQTGGLDGTTNTIVNTGSVDVNNQGTLTAIGTITNNGTIALQSSNQNTDFVIGAAGLTLNGTGTLAMSNNAGNRIYGAAGTDVLTNSTDVIQGAGQLGAGQLTFINSTSGTVDANLATSLVLNTGANVVTNNGLLESTSTGGLVIVSGVDDEGRKPVAQFATRIAERAADQYRRPGDREHHREQRHPRPGQRGRRERVPAGCHATGRHAEQQRRRRDRRAGQRDRHLGRHRAQSDQHRHDRRQQPGHAQRSEFDRQRQPDRPAERQPDDGAADRQRHRDADRRRHDHLDG